MKRLFAMILLPVFLMGCSAAPVFESVEDVYAPVLPDPGELQVAVPDDATVLTSGGEGGDTLYFCSGYTMTVQILEGGDLNRSVETLTGYSRDSLTVMQTVRDGVACYSCVWTSAGEGGDQVGRLVLLDDGAYHYAVSVMAPAAEAGALTETWDDILNRVTLRSTDS